MIYELDKMLFMYTVLQIITPKLFLKLITAYKILY